MFGGHHWPLRSLHRRTLPIKQRHQSLVGFAVLLTLSATSCASRAKSQPNQTPAVADRERTKALRNRKATPTPTPTLTRIPLATSGVPVSNCNAFEHYRKAAKVADKRLAGAPGGSASAVDFALYNATNKGLSSKRLVTLTPFLNSSEAAAIAKSVRVGAACRRVDITFFKPTGSPQLMPYIRAARTSVVIALYLAWQQKPYLAAELLVATARMGQDLMRAGPLLVWGGGLAIVRLAIKSIVAIAHRLNHQHLTQLLGHMRTLITAHPQMEAAVLGEWRFREQILEAFAAGKSARLHKDWRRAWTSILNKRRLVAVRETHNKVFENVPGVDGKPFDVALKQLQVIAGMWRTVSGFPVSPPPSSSSGYPLYLSLERLLTARLRAISVALTVILAHKKTGNWPTSLATLGRLPSDPISLAPFVYEEGKTIRSVDFDCRRGHCKRVVVDLVAP